MSLEVAFPNAETCVWMEARVISFWLCNRDFDCEHCPLDAALRGGSPVSDRGPQKPGMSQLQRTR